MAPMMRHAQMSHTVQMDREVQQRLMSPAEKDTLYKGATRPHMIVCVCCVCACVCRSVCVCVWCGSVQQGFSTGSVQLQGRGGRPTCSIAPSDEAQVDSLPAIETEWHRCDAIEMAYSTRGENRG